MWGSKYPILNVYQQFVDTSFYGNILDKLLTQLKHDYNLNDVDALLVLKDIMANVYKRKKRG